jgi:T5SS/PEP-CTERM-associated repeat protein
MNPDTPAGHRPISEKFNVGTSGLIPGDCRRHRGWHPGRGRIAALLALAALGSVAVPAARAQTLWTGASSTNWFTAGNWSPAAVPTSSANVEIDTNGGNQPLISSGSATTDNLTVGNDSSSGSGTILTVQGGSSFVTSGNAFIGDNTKSNGTLSVTGANTKWTVNGNITVGNSGSGSFFVLSGAQANVTGLTTLGGSAGGLGFIHVDGANSTLNLGGDLDMGVAANSTLLISNGGTIRSTEGEMGAGFFSSGNTTALATVTGANSTWIITGNSGLIVGEFTAANLTISNGGNVTSLAINAIGYIGRTSSENGPANGTVIVDGANSIWNLGNNTLVVADSAIANLTISNGGNVTCNGVLMGNSTGGTGTVLVTGNGSVWNPGANASLVVGNTGAANLTIASGGLVNATAGVVLSGNGGLGQLNLDSNGTLQIGGSNHLSFDSGNYAVVLGGGVLRVAGADLTTSVNATLSAGTNSTINTNGFNATWSGALSGAGSLIKSGAGNLTISGNASYTGNTTVSGGNLVIAGTFNIPSGATMQITGNVTAQEILVSAGGTLSGNGVIVGNVVNNGTVSLSSGTGQKLTVTGNLTNNGLISLLNGTGVSVSGTAVNSAGAIFDDSTGGSATFGHLTNSGLYLVASDVEIKGIQASGNNLAITIQSYPGHNYQLESCTNLVTADWVAVGSPQAGTGSVLTLTDTNALSGASLLFYRVFVAP